jgi:general secretion pathway protein B
MSYILEALKKAEQARNRGKAPELFAVQAAEVALPERRSQWPYLVVAVLAVNAAVLLVWLQPWHREAREAVLPMQSSAPDNQPALPKVAEVPAPAAVPASPAREGGEGSRGRPTNIEMPRTASPVQPQAVAKAASPHRSPEAKTASKASPAPARSEPVQEQASSAEKTQEPAAGASDAASEAGVMAFNELPDSIRQELGTMNVTVHMYSAKTADRFVSINDRALHEGDELSPGVKLEKITFDGMILSYKGYRFRRGIN